jgi:hypothetical protein
MLDKKGRALEPFWGQRVLWSLTEGGLAIALMKSSGSSGARGLRAMSITAGLPFTIVLCMMCSSLLTMLKEDEKNKNNVDEVQSLTSGGTSKKWKMHIFGGVLDLIEVIPATLVFFQGIPAQIFELGALTRTLVYFAISCVCPAIPSFITLSKINKSSMRYNDFQEAAGSGGCCGKSEVQEQVQSTMTMFGSEMIFNVVTSASILLCEIWFVLSIAISDEYGENGGWYAFAWSAYFFMALLMSIVRAQTRKRFKIDGNGFADLTCCFFLYFQAGHQYWYQASSDFTDDGEGKRP